MSLVRQSSVKWWMDSLTVQMWGHWLSMPGKRIYSLGHTNLLTMGDWHGWKMFSLHTCKDGNRAPWHVKEITLQTEDVSLFKPIRALWFPSTPMLMSSNSCCLKDLSMSSPRDLCRMCLRTTLNTKERKEEDQTIQLPNKLDIMLLPFLANVTLLQ